MDWIVWLCCCQDGFTKPVIQSKLWHSNSAVCLLSLGKTGKLKLNNNNRYLVPIPSLDIRGVLLDTTLKRIWRMSQNNYCRRGKSKVCSVQNKHIKGMKNILFSCSLNPGWWWHHWLFLHRAAPQSRTWAPFPRMLPPSLTQPHPRCSQVGHTQQWLPCLHCPAQSLKKTKQKQNITQ